MIKKYFEQFNKEQNDIVLVVPSKTDMSGVYISFPGSTLNEQKGFRGISHLLEHLTYYQNEMLFDDFNHNAISANAYTSQTEIVYHLVGLNEKVNTFIEKFVNNIFKFKPNQDIFNREKKIVMQEYFDSYSSFSHINYYDMLKYYLDYHSEIGNIDDITNFKFEQVENFWQDQHNNPKIVFVTNKPFEIPLKSLKFHENQANLHQTVDLQFKAVKSHIHQVKNKINDGNANIHAILKQNPLKNEVAVLRTACEMMVDGLKSPLYKKLREEKQYVYSIGLNCLWLGNKMLTILGTTTAKENLNNLIDDTLKVFKKCEISEKSFDGFKESVKIQHQIYEIERYKHIDKFLRPDYWSVYDNLNDITYDKMLYVVNKYLNEDNIYWYVSM